MHTDTRANGRRAHGPASGAGLRGLLGLPRLLPLPPELEPTFDQQVEAGIARLLPVLGPACGAFVILFGVWDAWLEPANADTTLRIRVAMVLLGAPAYAAGRLDWGAGWRCAWLYATHAGAVVVCATLLAQGLALALPGLTGAMFLLALVEPRPRRHDSLGGALPRGYTTELAIHDVALARRHRRPLAVAMLDIDHFKRVNDTYGHANGDLALCALVTACKGCLRASDYVGRIGGEEFVCVMPEADAQDAVACAERVRTAVARLCLPTDAGPLRFTVSAGVAVLAHRHGGWAELLRAADAALYEAKGSGRNRTVLARDARARPADAAPAATG